MQLRQQIGDYAGVPNFVTPASATNKIHYVKNSLQATFLTSVFVLRINKNKMTLIECTYGNKEVYSALYPQQYGSILFKEDVLLL